MHLICHFIIIVLILSIQNFAALLAQQKRNELTLHVYGGNYRDARKVNSIHRDFHALIRGLPGLRCSLPRSEDGLVHKQEAFGILISNFENVREDDFCLFNLVLKLTLGKFKFSLNFLLLDFIVIVDLS